MGEAGARARGVALLASLAAAAALVDLGRFHLHEHSDAIVPVLVSLQRWTPLYWDQERYGMLVPLLAWPVRDPFLNLLLQRGLLVLSGLAAAVLLARHALAGRDWALAGALAAGLLLLFAPGPWAFEFLGDQPYGLSIALAFGGLAVAEPVSTRSRSARGEGERPTPRHRWPRVLAGLLLVLLGHWVNPAVGILGLMLATVRAVADVLEGADRRAVRDRLVVDGLLLGAGLVAGYASIRAYPAITGKPLRLALGLLPAREWPAAWAAFFANGWREGAGWALALAAIAVAGAGWMWLSRPLRRVAPEAFLRAGALVAVAIAYALFAGALRWVADNGFAARYLAPSAVLLHLAAISLVAEPLARLKRGAGAAFAVAGLLVPAAALASWGAPSLDQVRGDLQAAVGRHTADVRAAGCNLVTGDYWSVWTTVFDALRVAHERGEPAALWGVCHRSNPTVPEWRDAPRSSLRICAPLGEEAHAERWLRAFHLWPAREVARVGTERVLVPDDAAPLAPAAPPARIGPVPAAPKR